MGKSERFEELKGRRYMHEEITHGMLDTAVKPHKLPMCPHRASTHAAGCSAAGLVARAMRASVGWVETKISHEARRVGRDPPKRVDTSARRVGRDPPQILTTGRKHMNADRFKKWQHFTIAESLPGHEWGTGGTGLGDFTGNGVLDVAVSRRETETAYWF